MAATATLTRDSLITDAAAIYDHAEECDARIIGLRDSLTSGDRSLLNDREFVESVKTRLQEKTVTDLGELHTQSAAFKVDAVCTAIIQTHYRNQPEDKSKNGLFAQSGLWPSAQAKMDAEMAFANVEQAMQEDRGLEPQLDPDMPPRPFNALRDSNTTKTVEGVWAHVTKSGGRKKQEDFARVSILTHESKEMPFFSVYDGHGDDGCWGPTIHHHLPMLVNKATGSIEDRLSDALKILEQGKHQMPAPADQSDSNSVGLLSDYSGDGTEVDFEVERYPGGTTMCGCLLTDDKIITINVGDSRGIFIGDDGVCTPLSADATPSTLRFYEEIVSEGRSVERIGRSLRVATLNVARDIGQEALKPDPALTTITKQPGYILLATDGFWDCASNTEAAATVREMLALEISLESIVDRLTEAAKPSRDNCTVMLYRVD